MNINEYYNNNYYNMGKVVYVCSYGGCGSTMLYSALQKIKEITQASHVHSRTPPDNLEYIGHRNGHGKYCYREWFNGVKIPEDEIKDYYVLYIYRNPVKCIVSRFQIPEHLQHIQVDKNIKLDDVLNKSEDLYGIHEFYNNYTQPNEKRNYKIISVKYEEIFDKQDELSEMLGIGPLNLVKKESNPVVYDEQTQTLNKIYKDLTNAMDKNDFIMIN